MLSSEARTPAADLLTEIVLLVFRVNGQLLESGDRLVAPLQLTSARWQILGAIALAESHRSAPHLAARMGMSRQGAQKQLDLLLADGLVKTLSNPGHARSPLYALTRKGRSLYTATEDLQAAWTNRLARGLSIAQLETARHLLKRVSQKLLPDNDHRRHSRRRPHAKAG